MKAYIDILHIFKLKHTLIYNIYYAHLLSFERRIYGYTMQYEPIYGGSMQICDSYFYDACDIYQRMS